MDTHSLRNTIAHYFAAYHREVRSQLEGRSFSIETVPSHLMPWKRLVRIWETGDGHFLVEHISSPADASYLGYASGRSDLYEDYLHLDPPRTATLSELLGIEMTEETAPLMWTEIYGKRIGDAGYDAVQQGYYLEREDGITRAKIPELTEQEAQEAARTDLQPYLQ